MAKNKTVGDNQRKGAVKTRSQIKNPITGTWTFTLHGHRIEVQHTVDDCSAPASRIMDDIGKGEAWLIEECPDHRTGLPRAAHLLCSALECRIIHGTFLAEFNFIDYVYM